VALGLPFFGYGFINHWGWFILGGFLAAWGIVGWMLEPAAE
jgi:hypothetical protein